MSLPRSSIVIPNFFGREHLGPCLASIAALQTPADRLEILVVDNGSRDGSLDYLRRHHSSVRVLDNGRNLGFSAACNRGAAEAHHEVVVFLNNDMRVDPAWLDELLKPIAAGKADATASKILSWDGKKVNFAGGGMNFHGIGIQIGLGEDDGPAYRRPKDTLFACGGAMAIRRAVLREAGGFDEEFFAYYEDVDLGWRLWVMGYRVAFVPTSITYHHHSATAKRVDLHRLRVLQIRNPLAMIYKNYDERSLGRVLPAALLLTMRRTWYLSRLTPEAFRIEGIEGLHAASSLLGRLRKTVGAEQRIPKVAAADLVAIADLTSRLPRLHERRLEIQAARRRQDVDILKLFVDPFWPAEPNPEYHDLVRFTAEAFRIRELFGGGDRKAGGDDRKAGGGGRKHGEGGRAARGRRTSRRGRRG